MRKGLQQFVLWLLSTRWVEPIVLLPAGALAWLGSMFLPGLSAVWLSPLGLMAFLGVVALSPQRWGRFSAAAVSLLARHTGSVVTVATFTASAALVAFAMVASVATPELGQELSKAGELFNVVGRPVGWGLMMVPFALQTILAAFAAEALPKVRIRTRRVLATLALFSGVVLLVLFAVVTQHVAVLALTAFVDSQAANPDISTTTTVVLHDR